ERVSVAVQEKQLGTGDAARAGLQGLGDFRGWVLLLCGDTPLVHSGLVRALLSAANTAAGPLVMLTSQVGDPSGYGRILRDERRAIVGVREHKDATPDERAIVEVNPGIYAARAAFLREALSKLSTNNAQGELYLTDVVEQAAGTGGVTGVAWPSEDTSGVNDRAQLAECERTLRLRIVTQLARS